MGNQVRNLFSTLGIALLFLGCAGPQGAGGDIILTSPESPLAPSSLATTSVTDRTVDLTWKNNALNSEGVIIERSIDINFSNAVVLGAFSPASTYHDSELIPYTTYYYRVKAFNIFGQSSYTATIDVMTNAPPDCTYSLSTYFLDVMSDASTGRSISLETQERCPWSATSTSDFITITSASKGIGSGSMTFNIKANSTFMARYADLRMGSESAHVQQFANPDSTPPSISIQSPSTSGTYATHASSIDIGGIATDNAPVISLRLENLTTGGTASLMGTPWTFRSVPLASGPNNILVSVQDIGGNIATASIIITYEPCVYSISPTSRSISASAATGSINITTQTGCTWTAVSANTSFLTVTSGNAGSGNGTATYSVLANTSVNARSTSITIAEQTFNLSQAGLCTYTITPTSVSVSASASTGSVQLMTGSTCTWAASSLSSFLTLTSTNNGTGPATLNYSVSANASTNPRSGSLLVNGISFAVNQSAVPDTQPPTLSISSPTPNSTYSTISNSISLSGSSSDNVSVTSITWSNPANSTSGSTSGASWSIPSIPLIPGANTITVTARDAAGNASSSVLTVTYTPCSYTISPTSVSVTASETMSGIVVTTQNGCTWTATSHNPNFLAISSGATGVSSGVVIYSVLQNTIPFSRSGTMSVANHTFTLTQSAGPDIIAPAVNRLTPTLATTYITALSTVTLTGTASDDLGVTLVSWANSANSTSGLATGTSNWTTGALNLQSGNNLITITARDAAGNVGTSQITVNRTTCSVSLSKTTDVVGAIANQSYIDVTAPAGCPWTSDINSDPQSIMTITSGFQGNGNGAVSYKVSENLTTSGRTASLLIGGNALTINQDATTDTGSPSTLTGNLSANTIALNWIADASNAISFQIDVSTEIRPWEWFLAYAGITPKTATIKNSLMRENASYHYRTRSLYSNEELSRPSDQISFINAIASAEGFIPTAPSGLSLRKSMAKEVAMNWSSTGANELGFRIERSTGNPSDFQYLATRNKSIRVFSDRSAEPSTTYYYRVKAFGTGGDSGYSNILNVTTPAIPTDLVDHSATWVFVLLNDGTPVPTAVVDFLCGNSLISTLHGWFKEQTSKYGKAKPISQIRCLNTQITLPSHLITPSLENGAFQPLNETEAMSYLNSNYPEISGANYVSTFYYLPASSNFSFHTKSPRFAFNYLMPTSTAYFPSLSVGVWGEIIGHELFHLLGATDKYTTNSSSACVTDSATGLEVDGYDIMCHRVGDAILNSGGYISPPIDELIVSLTTAYELGWSATP